MSPWWWIPIGIGVFIGIVLVLLTAVLTTRTAVILRYLDGEITFRIRVLGIPVTLYPRKEKPKKKKKKREVKQKQTTETEEKATEKTSTKDRLLASVKELKLQDYIELLRIVLTDFVGKFGFEKLIIHIAVGGDDAMKIAVTYGELNALLYPLLGALAAADKLEQCDIQITPDFASEEFRAEGLAVFSVRLGHALNCVLKILKKL